MLDQELVIKSQCIRLEGGKDGGAIHISCSHEQEEKVAARMAAETIAAQQAALRDAEHRLDRLIAEAEEVLDELDDRADVTDGPDGRPAPDWTMSLANTLRDALTAARR